MNVRPITWIALCLGLLALSLIAVNPIVAAAIAMIGTLVSLYALRTSR